MKFRSHLETAKKNLFRGRLRTILAMLGIIVGTGSVVALISSGFLATDQALRQFQGLGLDLLSISFYPNDLKNQTKIVKVQLPVIMPMEYAVPGIQKLAPYMISGTSANFNVITLNPPIIGATENLASVLKLSMKEGRFINELDRSQYFCVIGQGVLGQLKTLTPLGKQIRLGALIYTIVGVVDTWQENRFFNGDINNAIIVPMNSMSLLSSGTVLNNAIMRLEPDTDIDLIKSKINAFFATNIVGYTVNIQSSKELLITMAKQQSIFTLLLGCIGGISLFVGGIGVMNIMLASVSERKYEIGVRLALGAEPKDIQWMFLIEAGVLASIGGGAGVLLGNVSTYLVSQLSGWAFTLYLFPSILGFVVSLLISLFFGFYPAYMASKLDPITTLRGV